MTELEWIRSVDQIKSPFLDGFFIFLNFFDTQWFIYLLMAMIWVGYHWRWGLRLSLMLIINSLVNKGLKAAFLQPRPFEIDPSVAVIQVSGFGFPSGAAQMTALLTAMFLFYIKNPWKWLVAAIYFPLVSFSRVYLGVHFFSDVIGGWLVGALLFGFFQYLFIPLESKIQKISPLFLLLMMEVIGLALYKTHYGVVIMSLGLGLAMTYYFHAFLHPAKTLKAFLVRSFVGICGSMACLFLFPPVMASVVAILWISCGSQFLLRYALKRV